MDPQSLLSHLKRNERVPGDQTIWTALSDFNSHNKDSFVGSLLDLKGYSELTNELFKLMQNSAKGSDVDGATLARLKQLFICLRILSRGKDVACEISKKHDYFTTLMIHGKIRFDEDDEDYNRPATGSCAEFLSSEVEIEALKVVCNCIFHSQDCRGEYKKTGCSKHITNRLDRFREDDNTNLKSILVKILFLMSALDPDERENMRFRCNTVSVLIRILEGNVRTIKALQINSGSESCQGEIDTNVEQIAENLKTLFNISVKVCDESLLNETECQSYCQLVSIFHCFLSDPTISKGIKSCLVAHIANSLINLPKNCLQKLIPAVKRRPWQDSVPIKAGYPSEYELKDMSAVITLVSFLDEELEKEETFSEEKSQAFSILVSLSHICRYLPLVRKFLRPEILSRRRDVSVRPEQSRTLKGRIIKLMTHPETNIKNIAADFLFVLCKENPEILVKHTGYGNAAGLLAARGLLGGKNDRKSMEYSSDDDDSDTEEYSAVVNMVDPITGGLASNLRENPLQNMTDEEKEASATELMSLIERMSELKVIKPMSIGEDGRPKEVDPEEAKRLVNMQLDRDRASNK